MSGVESPRPAAVSAAPAKRTPTATAKSGGAKTSFLSSKPSMVVHSPMRFLIMDAPRQHNLHLYIKECKRYHVTDIVRVCEPTYQGESDLRNAGIELHDWPYDDGTSPPKEVLSQWLELVRMRFLLPPDGASSRSATNATSAALHQNGSSSVGQSASAPTPSSHSTIEVAGSGEKTIAVHCVAGLGRAPVLVAIALIEFAQYDPVDAVTFIRKHRRGAINEKQLQYLEQYTPQTNQGCSCVIM